MTQDTGQRAVCIVHACMLSCPCLLLFTVESVVRSCRLWVCKCRLRVLARV
jgi:hypothetical protein